MRLFQVVERIVELFQPGQLPLGRGSAGQMLEQYWRLHRPQPESIRRNAYWRMFGVAPGGEAEAFKSVHPCITENPNTPIPR